MNSSIDSPHEPSLLPTDFCRYVPWVCQQLRLDYSVIIKKNMQDEYVSLLASEKNKKNKSRAKLIPSKVDIGSDQEKDEKSVSPLQATFLNNKVVKIYATFDNAENLTKVTFPQNKNIPRLIWKVITLIVKFYPQLNNITIIGGTDRYSIYEMCHLLNYSHVTEIDICDSRILEGNYYLLLDNDSNLRCLSLSRCNIDDTVFVLIASRLRHPLPASKKLRILNLSSNAITDKSMYILANALRSNRRLCYLNLSNNRLTDTGACLIFNTFLNFPLTSEEVFETRSRYVVYLRLKKEMVKKCIADLKNLELEKKIAKKKSAKPTPNPISARKAKLEKDLSVRSLADTKSCMNIDSLMYEKALNIVETEMGNFDDPYNSNNTYHNDGTTYCKGNNSIYYLNLSYNSLSCLSIKKLSKVLSYQNMLSRMPKGLVNVIVEGNPLANNCRELYEIDDLIDIGLMSFRKISVVKRRQSRVGK